MMQTSGKSKKRVKGSLPLYRQIAEELKVQILNNEYPYGTALPSESELASAFGVNHLTLRKGLRILRDQSLIVQQHGRGNFVIYKPEISLRIALFLDYSEDVSGLYDLRIYSKLNLLAAQNNYTIIPIPLKDINAERILNYLHEFQCDGVVVFSLHQKNVLECLESSAFDHIPVVQINGTGSKINKKWWYSELKPGAISKAVNYLKQLGHRKIAYISIEDPDNHVLIERNDDFINCKLKNKLIRIGKHGALWYDHARNVMKEISLMLPEERPTAVICSGFTFSTGAWIGALENHLRIPEDISLIGFDGEEVMYPGMTTLKQPLHKIISKAIEILKEVKISGNKIEKRIYQFEAELLERGSCRSLK